jgi:hypothetical protein
MQPKGIRKKNTPKRTALLKSLVQLLARDCCLSIGWGIATKKEAVMNGIKNKMVVFLAVTIGGMVGLLKGEEAKQKWVFRIRSKYDNRRQMAERKSIAKKGGVLLDDIEMAAYHKS